MRLTEKESGPRKFGQVDRPGWGKDQNDDAGDGQDGWREVKDWICHSGFRVVIVLQNQAESVIQSVARLTHAKKVGVVIEGVYD